MSKAAELAALIGSQTALSNRNLIINGAMQIAQRGTSFAGLGGNAEAYYAIDRIKHLSGGTSAGRYTATQEAITDLAGFPTALKLACTTEDTSIAAGEFFGISHYFEGQNVQRIQKGYSTAKSLTLSFYVKGNASATYTAELKDTDNSRTNGQIFNVTTSWTRVELTYPADTTGKLNNDNALSFALNLYLHAGSTYTGGTFINGTWASEVQANRISSSNTSFYDSTNRTFFITGIQLEVGEVATPFEHESYAATLQKCQRYFQKRVFTDADAIWVGANFNATSAYGVIEHIVTMRAEPSGAYSGTLADYKYYSAANTKTPSTMTINSRNSENSSETHIDWSGDLNSGGAGWLRAVGTNAFVQLEAEL